MGGQTNSLHYVRLLKASLPQEPQDCVRWGLGPAASSVRLHLSWRGTGDSSEHLQGTLLGFSTESCSCYSYQLLGSISSWSLRNTHTLATFPPQHLLQPHSWSCLHLSSTGDGTDGEMLALPPRTAAGAAWEEFTRQEIGEMLLRVGSRLQPVRQLLE